MNVSMRVRCLKKSLDNVGMSLKLASCFERRRNMHSEGTVKLLELDRSVETHLIEKNYHPRNHPGVRRNALDKLPDYVTKAMALLTEGYSRAGLIKEGQNLRRRLWGRLLPAEEKDYIEKLKAKKEELSDFLSGFDLDDNQHNKVEKKIWIKQVKDLIHPWNPLDSSTQSCLHYFVSRTPAEFCVLHKVFREIQRRHPDFVPGTLFDFGSGLGSGYWAVREVWEKPLREVFNVDSNSNMNELAHKIVTSSKVLSTPATGIFFRQFLPAMPEPTYDIVLSAFSLLDLPSMKDRMETVAKLWSKSDKYLVIVEDGTIAGYKAVMEARNLVLHLANECGNNQELNSAHVVSPCPHDFVCPKMLQQKSPCNFEVNYLTPVFLEGKCQQLNHSYSYVVLKRGSRPTDDPQWPRCIDMPSHCSKSVQITLCTSDGEINNISVIKKQSYRDLYRCVRKTKKGDLFPGQMVTKNKSEHRIDQEKAE